jgi:hypothetical protein
MADFINMNKREGWLLMGYCHALIETIYVDTFQQRF